jgi:hypothetical protein
MRETPFYQSHFPTLCKGSKEATTLTTILPKEDRLLGKVHDPPWASIPWVPSYNVEAAV